jgi:hypothetical protein
VTPVDQTKVGNEGNCLAACIASLLDLPIEDLFSVDESMSTPQMWDAVERWLNGRGLSLVYVHVREKGQEALLGSVVGRTSSIRYMAWGSSPRGLEHSVVYRDGELVHDPHPDRTGLIRVEALAFLVKLT